MPSAQPAAPRRDPLSARYKRAIIVVVRQAQTTSAADRRSLESTHFGGDDLEASAATDQTAEAETAA